jgi:ABC-type lipoprotein export system ATPase subunit/ABC-type antimicrobial peptide transport system permease subunit
MNADVVIETRDLSKVYGVGDVRVAALDGISLQIKRGEFIAVMGASGSGKSTLMYILGCLAQPTSGEYLLDGEDAHRLDRRALADIRSRKIGFIFQSYNLLARTTALRNVTLPLLYNRVLRTDAKTRDEKARALLEMVGLGDRLNHQPHELSGGQQQRVAIARSLINDPVMIIADEPTGNLDTRSGDEVLNILRSLHRKGVTIVMVTHNPRIAEQATRSGGAIPSRSSEPQSCAPGYINRDGFREIEKEGVHMNPMEILRVSWEAIGRNKIRSILTMLGIIIGVAAVIIMVAISAGTEATIQENITGLGSNLIFVSSNFSRMGPPGMQIASGGTGLVFSDAAAIADQVAGVSAVVVEQTSSQTVKAGKTSLDSIAIQGTTPGFPEVRDMTMATGRYFNQNEVDQKKKVAVLGSKLAAELFGSANPIGQVIAAGSAKLTVIGVLAEKGTVGEVDYDTRLYTPITVIFDRFVDSQFARIRGDSVRLVYVKVADTKQIDSIILQIKLLLVKRHKTTLDNLDVTITTQQDVITAQGSTTSAFRSLLAWVAGVSLLVGGIGIMNIMLVSVTERTREIGIRQAVGAAPADILLQFLTEALLLSVVGGILGMLTGFGGAWLFSKFSDMRTVVQPASILLAFGSAATIGVFFGFYPASKAAQLEPIEALRYE